MKKYLILTGFLSCLCIGGTALAENIDSSNLNNQNTSVIQMARVSSSWQCRYCGHRVNGGTKPPRSFGVCNGNSSGNHVYERI